MLNLKLRDEFLGSQMPGTAIALRRKDNTGAAQRDPDFILSITYPTADVQTALRAVSANRSKRPIVLMGERGRGKSHIMAVMHHAVDASNRVQAWASEWGSRLALQNLSDLTLECGFVAISEAVHNHEYPLLWDLIFERHPRGDFFKGKFKQMAHPFPPRSLLEEMFEAQPVALILDEFQKWFDGLSDKPGPEGIKYRTCAENFIQNLSEISKDQPEILMPVISVLNNNTEAFRQVHRDGPIIIDFRGPTAREDRKKLLLFRLFENRENIPGIADNGNETGLITIWLVVIHGKGGQVQQRIVRLGMTTAGERFPHLERLSKDLLRTCACRKGTPLDEETVNRLVNGTASELLHRELMYSGFLPEDASYSSRLLACIEVVP